MNLAGFLAYRHIGCNPDTDEEIDRRDAAILDYLYVKEFVLEDGDEELLEDLCMVDVYNEEKRNYVLSLCLYNGPWYIEKWYDSDLINAMYNAGVDLTKENLDEFRKYCENIFDDKSERNKMLDDMASQFDYERI